MSKTINKAELRKLLNNPPPNLEITHIEYEAKLTVTTEDNNKLRRFPWVEPEYLNIDWGKGQAWPTPYRELDRDEFDLLMYHGGYLIEGINYRGNVYLPDLPEDMRRGFAGWDLHFYFWHSHAVFTADRYMRREEYDSGKWPVGKGVFLAKDKPKHKSTYGYAMRYFRLGCEHKWREIGQQEAGERGMYHYGMFCHINECTECGAIHKYDSSG